jgi:microsomal dipeptidase-like Zn-dependent dipeptidase
VASLTRVGFGRVDVEAICWNNWRRVLSLSWG